MKRGVARGLWFVASLVVLVLLLAAKTLPPTRAIAIWAVVLTGIVLRELVMTLNQRRAPKSRFERALLHRNAPVPEPSIFAGMERDLELATATIDHAHRRLAPLLRAAAAARLARNHGIDLERRPDAARQLLDEDTWNFVRPDRPEPANRHADGPSPEEIAAVVTSIEAL